VKQAYFTKWDHFGPAFREYVMPDKSPHRNLTKKPVKTIKEKRADKRAKGTGEGAPDPVAHLKKR